MSAEAHSIADDIIEAAEDAAIAIGQTDDGLIEATIIISEAIHDAVMAERERCATLVEGGELHLLEYPSEEAAEFYLAGATEALAAAASAIRAALKEEG